MSDSDETEDAEIDLAEALGAIARPSRQTMTLYIPDRSRDGEEIGTQRHWVLEAARMLAAAKRVVWERPVIVYTHVEPESFISALPRLRGFLHRLGRETSQGEVGFEFGGEFFRIQVFEP